MATSYLKSEEMIMLEELKKRVYEANMLLPKYDLVTFVVCQEETSLFMFT